MPPLRIPIAQKINKIHKTGKEYDRKRDKKDFEIFEVNDDCLAYLQDLVMNDYFAITFQTMSQYRVELLRVYNCLEKDVIKTDIRLKRFKVLVSNDICLLKFKKMFQYRTALIKALTNQ
jgi:hypothetical protein